MKKYLFTTFVFISISFSQIIYFSPKFEYSFQSDNEQFARIDLETHDFEISLQTKYSLRKFQFLSNMGYHFINGMKIPQSDFTSSQGLPHLENPPGLTQDQRNYYISDVKMSYGDSSSFFYINKWNKHWGAGVNSLILSKKIPSFLHFGFFWSLNDKFHFEYFHGKLRSKIHDEKLKTIYEDIESSYYEVQRNIVGHRLLWNVSDKLSISGTELVVYAHRSIELTYLLPFVSFFPLQGHLGDTDNQMISGEIQYSPSKYSSYYASILIDEWSPPFTFKKDNHNWIGWQAGLNLKSFLFKNGVLNVEFTWTDHRIYRHLFSANDYYSYGYPVGFWAGPHAQEFYLDYSFNILSNKIFIKISNATRGAVTQEMLTDQYNRPDENIPIINRFNGFVESKKLAVFSILRNLTKNIYLSLSYSYVDWQNSGNQYNTNTAELLIENNERLIKNSMGMKIMIKY